MSDFQIGDELEWIDEATRRNDRTRRFVTDDTGGRVYFRREGSAVDRDSVSSSYARSRFRVKRRPPAAPESFRGVFCAWVGQTPAPQPEPQPAPTALQRARQALHDYVRKSGTYVCLDEWVQEVVNAAKAEALADGADVQVLDHRWERDSPYSPVTETAKLEIYANKVTGLSATPMGRHRWRLVRVPA